MLLVLYVLFVVILYVSVYWVCAWLIVKYLCVGKFVVFVVYCFNIASLCVYCIFM